MSLNDHWLRFTVTLCIEKIALTGAGLYIKRRARHIPALVNHPAHILRRFHSPSLGCRVPQRFHILFLVPLRRDHRQARPLLKLLHIPDNRKSDWALKGQLLLLQDVHAWVHLRWSLQVGRMVKLKPTKASRNRNQELKAAAIHIYIYTCYIYIYMYLYLHIYICIDVYICN